MSASIRVTDATPKQRATCSCDECGLIIQTRGWINPERVALIRATTGSYVHGRCLR